MLLGLLTSLALAQKVVLAPLATGIDKPIYVTQEPGGPLLIVSQKGQIFSLQKGKLNLWLDVSKKISCCSERGLLGLAFHPQYLKNHRFFINYTDHRGRTIVEEYKNGQSVGVVIAIKQPYANHNGGHLAFGPDGYLYIGTGDGGSNGDPHQLAQNPGSLLGKMLRIDIDRGKPYGIPADNPFIQEPKFKPEIWALGFRQPWRYSFDKQTGDFYIGDIGQGNWEEIDFIPAPPGENGGLNFGWSIMEGNHCFRPAKNCRQAGLTPPIIEYSHQQGCMVIGGYVYRGQAIPELQGSYIFGDFCKGAIWAARWQNGWRTSMLLGGNLQISSFGQDDAGELYVVDYRGTIYKLVPAR